MDDELTGAQSAYRNAKGDSVPVGMLHGEQRGATRSRNHSMTAHLHRGCFTNARAAAPPSSSGSMAKLAAQPARDGCYVSTPLGSKLSCVSTVGQVGCLLRAEHPVQPVKSKILTPPMGAIFTMPIAEQCKRGVCGPNAHRPKPPEPPRGSRLSHQQGAMPPWAVDGPRRVPAAPCNAARLPQARPRPRSPP